MISDSVLSNNRVDFDGGGIFNEFGRVTISSSLLFGNSAHYGGAIVNFGEYIAVMTISGSILSGNSALYQGGAIFNDAALTITNSALFGNSAGNDGGGIHNQFTLTVIGSFIFGNNAPSGADLFMAGGVLGALGLTCVVSSRRAASAVAKTGSLPHCSRLPVD
jgi:hypothetical protein